MMGRLDETTLLVLPCSARKRLGGSSSNRGAPNITSSLSAQTSSLLRKCREANRDRARLDETLWLRAIDRYDGYLYRSARTALDAMNEGAHLCIVSGGYGVALGAEPIGVYDSMFRGSSWPERVVQRALEEYSRTHAIKRVRAFASRNSPYLKVLTTTHWQEVGVPDVQTFVPDGVGAGAMVKAPRALGEALGCLLGNGALPPYWQSSDGVRIEVLA